MAWSPSGGQMALPTVAIWVEVAVPLKSSEPRWSETKSPPKTNGCLTPGWVVENWKWMVGCCGDGAKNETLPVQSERRGLAV